MENAQGIPPRPASPVPPTSDSLPLPNVSLDDLDMQKVEAHIEEATKGRRYKGSTDPVEYLTQSYCAVPFEGTLYPTLAGILCFGRHPQTVVPRSVVDLCQYRGHEPLSFEVVDMQKNIGGTIFDQITSIESYLWKNIHHGMSLSKTSFKRIEIDEYPQFVIRELSVNMVAHRDYTSTLSVGRVELFSNRIEWSTPGGLLPGVTVDNILAQQAARNPVILQILWEAGYVEAFGRGLDTVVRVLESEKMEPPRFVDLGIAFNVSVYGRSLDLFYGEGIYASLTATQRKILSFIYANGEAAPRELIDAIEDRGKRSIQRDLQGLVEANLLRASGEGRALRYRLREDL